MLLVSRLGSMAKLAVACASPCVPPHAAAFIAAKLCKGKVASKKMPRKRRDRNRFMAVF